MEDYSKAWAKQNERRDSVKKLIEEHYKHDLQPSDRKLLETAQSRASLYTRVGSLVGLGLGLTLAIRLRATRRLHFRAFQSRTQPTSVVYADGRTQAFPDLTPLLKPSRAGDIATYCFVGGVATLLGAQVGGLAGLWGLKRGFEGEGEEKREARRRVERAWRAVRADLVRRQGEALIKQADALDKARGEEGGAAGEGGAEEEVLFG